MQKIKFLFLLILSTLAIYIRDLSVVLISDAILLFWVFFLSDRDKIIQRLKALLLIFFLIIIFQMVFGSFDLVSRFENALIAAGRIFFISLLVFIFTSTTSASQIVSIFSFLPAKLQLMVTILFSLIPVIIEEIQKIIYIQASKGHNFKKLNFFNSYLPIVVPLTHRILRRAEQISVVLQLRGWRENQS